MLLHKCFFFRIFVRFLRAIRMKRFGLHSFSARTLLLSVVLLASVCMFGAGFTPTDAGLVVDLNPGDQFLLSVWIDMDGDWEEDEGEEFFVCHYNGYKGGRFGYGTGNFLKLIPQPSGATEPIPTSIWTVGEPLAHDVNCKGETRPFTLDGICYTMWSSSNYTLQTSDGDFMFKGALSNNKDYNNLCDVAFVVPTVRARDNMDAGNTLSESHTRLGRNRGAGTAISPAYAFDGLIGTGFLGKVYREVYWFDKPRSNQPISYSNTSLVTFNTTQEDIIRPVGSGTPPANVTMAKGKGFYAFKDSKHNGTQRVLFRLYVLKEHPFGYCPDSYFFAHDEQDYVRYRTNKNNDAASYNEYRKIYTTDHHHCMERVGSTQYYKSNGLQIPESDSAFYYVGYANKFRNSGAAWNLGAGSTAVSQFTWMRQLRVNTLKGAATTFTPAPDAYGYMVVDTTSDEANLGITFEPAGYFFRSSRGVNVPMIQVDANTWITEQKWDIPSAYMALSGKVLLQTGAEFSMSDPGADIVGWSDWMDAADIPVYNHGGETAAGKSGWARIHTNSSETNGAIEFVLARTDRHVRYDNNGFAGEQIPDQYPLEGETTVTVQEARLKKTFTFLGWGESPEGPVVYWTRDSLGTGKAHYVGETINLSSEGRKTLYAIGSYNDSTYRVTFSFVQDGKRYYLTHPNQQAPRFARARHFTDWTNVHQGMSDENNSEPNYVTTYKTLSGNPGACLLCEEGEVVLDPRHEMVYGETDSLLFYKNWTPADDEYVGLYYTTPNVIIANDTWAGIFKSTNGWPSYKQPAINSTKLYSSHYFAGMKDRGSIERTARPRTDYVQYNSSLKRFDGVANAADATEFQISAVAVPNSHFVILPDTTNDDMPWHDQVVFDYHKEKQLTEDVWSKLIGKQLMACMMAGNDTVYFHPNDEKTLLTAGELSLAEDYRLTQSFSFIRDSRVATADYHATMSTTSNEHHRVITSGMSSPMNVVDGGGNYIDVVDTLRVWLRPASGSKIKEYYGRWKTGAPGLHVMADGSRYRDILIITKTYHYGATTTELVLKPEQPSYIIGALQGEQITMYFTVQNMTYRPVLNVDESEEAEDIITSVDVTDAADLRIQSSSISYTSGNPGVYFSHSDAASNHVTLTALIENVGTINRDTITVSANINYGGTPSTLTASVPLMQVAMLSTDLIWSVVYNKTRYFIVAGTGGLQFRTFDTYDGVMYKKGSTTELKVGSLDAANSDNGYITPWRYTDYGPLANCQLYFQTLDPVNRYFRIVDDTARVDASVNSVVTFEMLHVYVNDNGNYEEQAILQFGADQWLKFTGEAIVLTDKKAEASVFSWGYLKPEYGLENYGDYPDRSSLEFHRNRLSKTVQTRYKAFKRNSMLIDNTLTYLCKEECTTMSDLIDAEQEWKTNYAINLITDARSFDGGSKSSGLSKSTNTTTMVTTVSAAGASPTNVTIGGKYVDIVDTLEMRLSLRPGAPAYHFAGDWSDFTSVDDAWLKIPLICKTYHDATFDSVVCTVDHEEYRYTFPSTISTGINDTHTFTLETYRNQGTNTLDVDGNAVAAVVTTSTDLTGLMHLGSTDSAQIRLADVYGKIPTWCEISAKTDNTVTVRCLENGLRSPRTAYLYFAYVVEVAGEWRYVNMRITITQLSLFQYANNQHLVHSGGASGDALGANGMQQVHENKRILYYYNPAPYDEPDQGVELPVRERGFYGWWRWYREGDSDNLDIPNEDWMVAPTNSVKYDYPFRIIGDSVWKDEADHSKGKKLVTMGRYTVFHYPAVQYNTKSNPPVKNPRVVPPANKARKVTYAVDISNYYDNLPLSLQYTNQVDTAVLDTMRTIIEPTLSLREVFELHPWTEMADTLDHYKSAVTGNGAYPLASEKYMEDHVMMAPTGARLLLRTEQRYKGENLAPRYDKDGKLVSEGHSESLLGYYMHDDHWSDGGWTDARKDTMIWCGGWDSDCDWYTYDPSSQTYSECDYPITVDDDFLDVPIRSNISAGHDFDTVYFCLRSRSKSTTTAGTIGDPDPEEPDEGNYWFNICRYKIIYHRPAKYGPLQEKLVGGVKKALITNDEIEQTYEVLERLNFDYNKPGSEYTVHPHPLPWADASYGYSYPTSLNIPDNRYHNDFAPNFPGQGEYGLINRIPVELFSKTYWNPMEQHGGAENGYMIYCDGMSSAGQVAALELNTQLCQGQKIYFSGYVGNPYKTGGKSLPNFTFSVQGSDDGENWEDITSYTTGDIKESSEWYQIFFPIEHESHHDHFRVRIYNVASNVDGNDFIIDDMCVFATKPPLIAYQANTKCMEQGENDSLTNVVLRIDYQGFTNESYNNARVYYTVEQKKDEVLKYVYMEDGYMNGTAKPAGAPVASDALIYGYINMPDRNYAPTHADSVFTNLDSLTNKFEDTNYAFRQAYIYEHIDGVVRPVMYVIHRAKMTPDHEYKVRMSLDPLELASSICAMTSELKVTSLMSLEVNGEEQKTKTVDDVCPNTTYELSMRVKGTLHQDNTAPIDMNGSCMNDWLLFGDTVRASSKTRYGYYYEDIVKVVKGILRYYPAGNETNANLFAPNLAAVSRNEMLRIQTAQGVVLSEDVDPYTVLSDLVNKGFLILYQAKQTVTVTSGNSVQYVVMPIKGTGSDYMHSMDMEVCPTPLCIRLEAKTGESVPMSIGGMDLSGTPYANQPVVILADSVTASSRLAIRVDGIRPTVAVHSISLLSTDDPNFLEGVHSIALQPDKLFEMGDDNYSAGDSIILTPGAGNNYHMHQGYNYTFGIVMQTLVGDLTLEGGCPVGTVMFTVSVVPSKLRWSPIGDSNEWYKPMNWIGVDDNNDPIQVNARFAPLPTSSVIIPAMAEGANYPVLVDPAGLGEDSVKQVGYQYNTCDKIRFMPETAISQQQLLTYNKAVVDMSLPQGKWAFRATPVLGMLSGDVFMSNADLAGETAPWEVGTFDASGRNYVTGNASFWLSMYNREIKQKGNGDQVGDSTRVAATAWTRSANSMIDSLYPAQGWAVYTHTNAGYPADEDAIVRLPKNDDVFYYYYANGDKAEDLYEHNLQALRSRLAGGSSMVGKLVYGSGSTSFTLTNGVASTLFVFGNPTMGYIDIWGFIADNTGLSNEIDYMTDAGSYVTLSKASVSGSNTLDNRQRYLPPMHAMVIKVAEAVTSRTVTLNAGRIVTAPVGGGGSPAPARYASDRRKGIMTVTAVNPADKSCKSRLLLGQGYSDAVLDGEDAVLTTINVDDYSSSTPSTPFNIYALEAGSALCINLRDEVVNVPVSFSLSPLPFDPVTKLWFTGVNNIDGQLVLYDALTASEQLILDGVCLNIETPEVSYENRYYIRRQGWSENGTDPVTTDAPSAIQDSNEPVVKFIHNGHVLILRNGHVYTMYGQELR